jgi:hypothetical protein
MAVMKFKLGNSVKDGQASSILAKIARKKFTFYTKSMRNLRVYLRVHMSTHNPTQEIINRFQ